MAAALVLLLRSFFQLDDFEVTDLRRASCYWTLECVCEVFGMLLSYKWLLF